jgi:hypothetical protein
MLQKVYLLGRVIYTLVQGQLAKLEGSSPQQDTAEDYDEEAPLLSD